MKPVLPSSATSAVQTLLASWSSSTPGYKVDLYTFNLAGGGRLYYAVADIDVSFDHPAYGQQIWACDQVRFDRDDQKAVGHFKIGLDVDTYQVVASPRAMDDLTGAAYPDRIGGQPWLQALAAGALDGATVEVDYAFFAGPPTVGATTWTPVGAICWFYGRVATVDFGRSAAVISINSHLELLDIAMPRNLFGAHCRHTLFDAGCSLAQSAFAVGGTVGAGSTQNAIVSTAVPPAGAGAGGTFALGQVVMTSGGNAGYSRSIKLWNGGTGTMTLLAPFFFPVQAGDGFIAYPGCNKTFQACAGFGNGANFGGQPFIPAAESAV
jgi:uncharacterized phage protein (TIGR02218 family)